MKEARMITSPDQLTRCEGYHVYYPGGHLGFVEVILHGENGKPEAIAALGGVLGTRIVVIPVDEIAEIDPQRRRITLFDKPETGEPQHFAEVLRSHGHSPTG
jgi:hypothetical protein